MIESQAWFWTPEWQAMEAEVDEDLRLGRYETFDSMEELIESLETMLLSEPALHKEWDTPEEDEAWSVLDELTESNE